MTAVRDRKPSYGPRATWSWAFYDFANSSFTTLVITFVYATYFTQVIAPDPITGTALWSRAITITALITAICSPLLGALADRGGYRKAFVLLFSLVCVLATAALYQVLPGQIVAALAIVIVANLGYEFATVFYNAFLPDISPLTLPFLFWVPEDRSRISDRGRVVGDAVRQLRDTFAHVRRYRQIVRLLVARFFYNNGLVTVIAFGGIYAAETFGFTLQEVLVFGIVLNVAAGAGALLMGYFDDWAGGKRTIIVSLVGLALAAALAIAATDKLWLWVAGVITGIFLGPNQAASRSLMGRFVPRENENEFFGFFAFSGKLTAFVGPFLLGVLTQWTGSQRWGISVVLVMFAAGLVLLLPLDEQEGIERAQRHVADNS